MLGLALALALALTASASARAAEPAEAEVLDILRRHCVPCHAREPQHPAFDKPPRDLVLETVVQLRQNAEIILQQTVETRAMPLGNQTGMTEDERTALARWIAANK